MGWADWMRGREVLPSLYAADMARLGDEVRGQLAAGVRLFHFDVGDGHFVPPVTIGPIVLRALAPIVHDAGGIMDCHLMVADPAHHVPEFAEAGADSITFHVEAAPDPAAVGGLVREHGLAVGVALNPGTPVEDAARAADAAGAELVLVMSIWPGYSGQPFMPEALPRIERLAGLVDVPVQVDGGVGEATIGPVRDAGASLFVAGSAIFGDPDPAAAYGRLAALVA